MTKIWRALLFFSICIFNAPFAEPLTSEPPGIVISGRIISPDGEPVRDVYVRLLPDKRTAISNPRGIFKFNGLAPGNYQLSFLHLILQPDSMKVSLAQTDQRINLGNIQLKLKEFHAPENVVTATRTPKQIYDILQPVNLVGRDLIEQRNAKTSAEALREETGIFVQKTNHGGGSAIIRGLGSNQILLLVDGVRLNNSTYRLGNHQYLTTVDQRMLSQIEVVRGPMSVLYGSDALGGAINLISDPLSYSEGNPNYAGYLSTQFSSADRERSGNARMQYASRKFSLTAGAGYKHFGDLHRGKWSPNPELENSTNGTKQSPSGFSGRDFDLKARYQLSDRQDLIAALQFSRQDEVPRYDKYENENYHRWIYDPQRREMAYLKHQFFGDHPSLRELNTTLSFQRQAEGRKTRLSPGDPLTDEEENVASRGIGVQGISQLQNHLLSWGGDFYHDDVKSERRLISENGERIREARGRYPDGATYRSAGVFLQDEFYLGKGWSGLAGARYSYFKTNFNLIETVANDPFAGNISLDFQSVTGSAGLRYRLHPNLLLDVNFGQGFRAPNLSDLSKLGESKGVTYEIPNINLDPEKITSIDFGVKLTDDRISLTGNIFYSKITDLIASANATLNGADEIEIDGNSFKLKSKQNLGEAYITGIELASSCFLNRQWQISGNFTALYGQNTTADEPVGGLPPVFGKLSVAYQNADYQFEFYGRAAAGQNRISADDRDDPRIPPNGTPGWFTLNLRGSRQISSMLHFQAAIENILDLNYREHGSGINGPGRNFIIGIRISP